MAKTLVDFRAEKGLYLKDIATEIGVPEEELKAIEESGVMPDSVATKLIELYYLPDDYFTADSSMSHLKNPKNPTAYFFKVSFVCSMIAGVLTVVPTYIALIIGIIMRSNSATVLESPVYDIIIAIYQPILYLLSGVVIAKWITKKTVFSGDIEKYRFLYPVIPTATVLFFTVLCNFGMSKVSTQYAGASSELLHTQFLLLYSAIVLISFANSLLSNYICALVLKNATTEDCEKKTAFWRKIAVCITVSTILAFAVYIFRTVTEGFSVTACLSRVFTYALYIILSWVIVRVQPKNEKQEKLIYVVLPIISVSISSVFVIIGTFTG